MIKNDYASNPGFELVLDQPLFHGDRHKAGWYNIVQLCFPERRASDLSPDSLYKVNSATIQWKMDWGASLYATTIPIVCIPKDAAEILVHLCEHNERKWMEFCDWADGYLDGLVSVPSDSLSLVLDLQDVNVKKIYCTYSKRNYFDRSDSNKSRRRGPASILLTGLLMTHKHGPNCESFS